MVTNFGTLSIDKRTVTLTSESMKRAYDGNELTMPEVTIGGEGFVDGEVTDCKAIGSALIAGDVVTNTIEYTEGAAFKSGNYEITKNEGSLEITKRSVTVTITGNTDSKPYNGDIQSVYDYSVEISDALYAEQDFTYNNVAVAGGIDVGEYPMSITPDQFLNLNNNFDVTFVVIDGKMTIEQNNSVVVKIIGRDEKVEYDGTTHTFGVYDVEISDSVYTVADFEFRGTDCDASGKNVGEYAMQMKPEDFVNINKNFGTVTFEVVNGILTVEPREVSIEWSEDREYPYDGKEHKPEAWVGNLAEGDSCEVTVEGGQTEIGDDYYASAVALSNPNYKLSDIAQIPFEIYGCVVIFADDYGNELLVKTVPYGEIPSYDGEEPTKRSYYEEYHYEFTGWTPEFVPVAERYTTYTIKNNYEPDKCKIYFADTGLLMGQLGSQIQNALLSGKDIGRFKGGLFENIIGEALVKAGFELVYFKRDKTPLEEDFFVECSNQIVPVEVKANTEQSKSLRTLIDSDKYPEIIWGIKFAKANVGFANNILTLPHWTAFLLDRLINIMVKKQS